MKCERCGGAGSYPVYILCQIDSSGRRRPGKAVDGLRCEGDANEYRRSLPPDYDLVSAARRCSCIPREDDAE